MRSSRNTVARVAGLIAGVIFAGVLSAGAADLSEELTKKLKDRGVQVRDCSPYSWPEGVARLSLCVDAISAATANLIADYPVEYLVIYHGKLNYAWLEGQEIEHLVLDDVETFGDPALLELLPLKTFSSEGAVWTDIRVFGKLPAISSLSLKAETNACVDIGPLSKLEKLKELDLWGGWGPDFSALSGKPLKTLKLASNPHAKDLSPLKGMKLETLDLGESAIADLSFLKGMKLEALNISGTSVTNIESLRGMPLKKLWMDGLQIGDVSALEGMPLESLVFEPRHVTNGLEVVRAMTNVLRSVGTDGSRHSIHDNMQSPDRFWKKFDSQSPAQALREELTAKSGSRASVSEYEKDDFLVHLEYPSAAQIRALQDYPVKTLVLEWSTMKALPRLDDVAPALEDVAVMQYPKLQSIEAVRPLSLVYLMLHQTGLSDIGPVENMKTLQTVVITDSPVVDLEPIRDLPLETLRLTGTKVSDISVLQTNQTLKELCLSHTEVADLTPVGHLELESLSIASTRIANLAPLAEMPLKSVDLRDTQVESLAALKGMPLKKLLFRGTTVSDLSPLRGMPLEHLDMSNTRVRDLSPLRGMSLKTVYFSPPAITNGLSVLKEMKTLEYIGTEATSHANDAVAPDVFWRKLRAGGRKTGAASEPARVP